MQTALIQILIKFSFGFDYLGFDLIKFDVHINQQRQVSCHYIKQSRECSSHMPFSLARINFYEVL